jgi:lipid-A-disaccharide synthase-like uncharacterized protein
MTLRHRFSPVLRFGSRAILVVSYHNFRPSGFVPPVFTGFALFGGQAILVFTITRLDPLTLRRQLWLVLPCSVVWQS